MFSQGDKVKYTDDRDGSTKYGTIALVVPAGWDWLMVCDILADRGVVFRSHCDGGAQRDHESYAVLVNECGRTMPMLYWPRVSVLEMVAS